MKLNTLLRICEFLSKVLGPAVEIVLHDLVENKILWIANGELTGRACGEESVPSTIRLLDEQATNTKRDYLLGYKSISVTGHPLRSSSLFIHDDTGLLHYSLCINQDISFLTSLQQYVDAALGAESTAVSGAPANQTIEEYTLSLIVSEVEKAKPFKLDSRESKMAILRSLDQKGVFEVHRAVPKVCDSLQIAPATLYKYLKEIRDGGKSAPDA